MVGLRAGFFAALLGIAAGQETRPEKPAGAVTHRSPRKGEFAPGALPEADKKKKFDELTARTKRDARSRRAASKKRQEWLDGLEKQYGIYDIATFADNGDSAKRVDVVVVTAGYAKSEAARVNQMAESLKTGLLKVDPFRNYPLYINFHRVNVNDPNPASSKVPFRVQSDILSCDLRKALEYADHAPAADLVVVLCNVPPCRATASGPVITIDASLDMSRTFLHEMGHAFARLTDEYIEPGNEAKSRPAYSPEQEEAIVNVTMVSNPKHSKWHYWMPPVWNSAHAPNRLPSDHKIAHLEGAGLYGRGVYRPEDGCLMRTEERYCVVCFEQVEKQFYQLIAPIDDARPRRPKLGLFIDESVTFEGDAIQTASSGGKPIGEFRGFWYVDHKPRRPSQAKNLTTQLGVQAVELGEGKHEVALRVDFSNTRVRRDHGWLSSARGWQVDVVKHRRPKFEGPEEIRAQVGKPVEFDLKIANPDATAFRLEAIDLPEGAAFADGKFQWTPAKAHQGAWRPRFALTDGLRTVTRDVEISVLDPAEKESFKPIFLPMEPAPLTAGETEEVVLDVADVDGDNLLFTSPSLPDGMELDPVLGVLKWKPTSRQVGRYAAIPIEVWDGTTRVKGAIDLVVEEDPEKRRGTEDVLLALRHPSAVQRISAVKKLEPYGRMLQCLEAARLLRDRASSVRGAALGVLKTLSDTADEAMLGFLVKDFAPHAWAFTDDPDALAWLGTLVVRGKGDRSDLDALKAAIKAIDKYNKDRGK